MDEVCELQLGSLVDSNDPRIWRKYSAWFAPGFAGILPGYSVHRERTNDLDARITKMTLLYLLLVVRHHLFSS